MKNQNLGRQGKDTVTGFEGIIISEHQYLTGCTQYGLQPKIKEDGSLPEAKYFDATCVQVTGEPMYIPGTEEDPGCEVRERP